MVGNPYRWRATIPQLEHRNATAGCLLAVLFIVPFLAKTFHINMFQLAVFVALYVCLIVPLGTGIISKKYLIGRVRKTSTYLLDSTLWWHYLEQLLFLLSWLHFLYLQLEGIHITTMQVVFNMAAEKVFCPEQRLCCLYVLLFYSVLAYLQRSLQTRPWTQLLSESTTAEFLKLTTAFIIVRLGKGVAMSLVLLTFTLQFNHLEPSYTYVIITFLYFMLTQFQNQKPVISIVTKWLSLLELQGLEGMEEYWTPVLSNILTVTASVLLTPLLVYRHNFIVLFILLYTNLYVPAYLGWESAWKPLGEQRKAIAKYPLVTWKNTQVRAGVPCAVCLDSMRLLSARCTPCGHVFHGSCLRRCLEYSSYCPLCKHDL